MYESNGGNFTDEVKKQYNEGDGHARRSLWKERLMKKLDTIFTDTYGKVTTPTIHLFSVASESRVKHAQYVEAVDEALQKFESDAGWTGQIPVTFRARVKYALTWPVGEPQPPLPIITTSMIKHMVASLVTIPSALKEVSNLSIMSALRTRSGARERCHIYDSWLTGSTAL